MTANVVHPAELERMLQARVDAARERRVPRPGSRSRSSSGGRLRRGTTTSISAALLFVLSAVVALGVHGNPAFELDGNSVPQTADDWDDVYNGTDSALVTTGIVPDEYGASKVDDQFTLGSKDTDDVSEWNWKAAVPPSDKTDLQNAYAALYEVGGELYLFLGADRDATNGNAKLGFWIFQDEIGLNADGTFSGEHKEGDLLIESAYTAGGTELGNINVWQWQGGDGTAGALSAAPITVGADCRANPIPTSDGVVCSINNDEAIDVAWPYQGKKLGNDTPDPSEIFAGGFNETGINLDFYFPGGIPCFSNVLAETRAAGSSVTSATEDFVLGSFETCGNIDAHKYLDGNGNGQLDAGEPGLEGWTINLYEADGITLIDSKDTDSDGDVTFEDLEAGDYVVCEELLVDTPAWANSDPGGGELCKDLTLALGGSQTVNFGNGQPSIDVTKSVDLEDVCAGTEVTYTITVANDGNVTLTNVDVIDDHLGDIALDLTLEPGDSETYNPTATPLADVTNTVTATAEWGGLTPAASDTAQATVDVHDCSIDVTKAPDVDEVCIGADTLVTYTYHVINDGDVELTSVTVDDDTIAGAQAAFELANGGSDTLAVGADIEFTLTATINATTTNTVDVAGDALGQTPAATDSAEATVTAFPCGEGCTPGFWQGGFGAQLWDEPNDPDWGDAGGVGTNPFDHETLFNDYFTAHASLDGMSMLEIVGTGGGNAWPRKAARDVVAAYLNGSFGLDYEFTTTEIEQMWTDAVNAGGTAGFRAVHADLGPANEAGCSIGSSDTATSDAVGAIPLVGLVNVLAALRRRGGARG